MIKKLLLFVRSLLLNFSTSFKSPKIGNLKKKVVQFSQSHKDSHVWSFYEMAGFKAISHGKKYLFIVLFSVFVNSVSGQIAQRGIFTSANTTGTTLTINKPTGIIAGDIMIVNIAQKGTGNLSDPTATGWNLIAGADLGGSTDRWGTVLYKIATATDAAPGTLSYAFSLDSQANGSVGSIVAFSGVDQTTPFDVANGAISVQVSQTAVAAGTKITATANAAVVMFGMAANGSPTFSGWTTTSPGALTELYDNQSTNNATVGAAWAIKPIAGSTGSGAAALSGGERNGGILVILRPIPCTTPTTSNAGADQTKSSGAFTLAANTPTVGTGAWSITSGPSSSTGQFSSLTNPTATFTPAVSGTYVLRWTISNSCATSTDEVVVANCVNNLIINGDFANAGAGNNLAANWSVGSVGTYVETHPENTYFSTGNSNGYTAELDGESSIKQTGITVVPNVSYTVSFIYARRPGTIAPANTGVTVKVTGGTTFTSTEMLTSVATPTIGTFQFTPTSSPIAIDFYNASNGGVTYGTIIDNVVLIPTSQVAPIATTSGGSLNTSTACAGTSVQLNVGNVPGSGVTYAWTGTGGAAFSSTTIQNPTVTFTTAGLQQATVTTTTSGSCSSASTTYVYINAIPTATAAGPDNVCQSASPAAITLNGASVGGGATTGAWSIISGGGALSSTGQTGSPATVTYTPAANYTGTVTLRLTSNFGTGCTAATSDRTINVNAIATATAAGPNNVCQSATPAAITLSGASFGGGATTAAWSIVSGGGALSSTAQTISPATVTYTPAANYTGTVTLRLTSNFGTGCTAATSDRTINVNAIATATAAGPNNVCQSATPAAITLSGASFGGGATTAAWSIVSGGGALSSTAQTISPATVTYTPAANYTGTVTLRLTSNFGTGCTAATSDRTINVNAIATATAAGPDNVCQSATPAAITLSGASFGGGATTAAWSIVSGGGALSSTAQTISPATVTYTPAANYTGTVTLRLTSNFGTGCTAATSDRTINVNAIATATAAGPDNVCQSATPAAITLSGASFGGGATTGAWSIISGGGALSSTAQTGSPATVTYTPAANYTGTVTLRLTSNFGTGCTAATSDRTINVNAIATATAAGPNNVCQSATPAAITLSGASFGGGATTAAWSIVSGGGALSSTAQTISPATVTYTPAANYTGTVTLRLTSNFGTGCTAATSDRTINVNAIATATAAGPSNVCQLATPAAITLSGASFGGGATTAAWSIVSGGGALSSTAQTISPATVTYTPAANYTGTVTLRLTSNFGTGCTAATSDRTINVNAIATATAAGPNNVCQSATPAAITLSGASFGGGATTAAWSIVSGGGALSSTAQTISPATVTYTPAANYTGTVTLRLTSNFGTGCTAATSDRTINVNALPSTPTASVTVQPTCSVNTGIIVVTAPTGAGITYSIDGTNYYTSGTFNNVAIGSYTVSVKNSSDCATTMALPLSVSPPVTKTWQGGQGSGTQLTDWSYGPNWSPAGIPTSADCVIIPTTPNNPIISGTNLEFYANTLSVIANGSLIVQSGNTLKVTDAITVAPTGTLTFQDSSTLLQESTDNTINSGNIEYIRTTLPIRQADYVYWSTPVKGQTLAAVSPLTESDKYFRFDGTGWVATPKTTIMTVGKGYIIRGPEGSSNTVRTAYTATFKGTPNNGTITTETFSAGKNYLIGNPYPSAIDADKFISDLNNKGLLQGTLYFWTHNTPVTLGGYYRYNADDYASYNLSGGTKTMKEAKTANNAPGNINSAPQGYIAAGQSFMAGLSFGGQIQFTNSMRVGADKNAQFFKPGKTSKTTAIEKNRVWLNLTNEEGAFKQMLVGYIEGASNDYDRGYDGLSFDGNKYIDFYSIGGVRKFVIQGRALPFTDTDTVPLGYKTTIAGDFTISIDQADGIFTTQSIYLEDKTTGKIQDLRAANYTFTTAIGTFADRFVLRYTNKTLGTGDFENVENGLLVAVKDKTIKVTSAKETIKEVTIFDINGKLLYSKKKVGSTELQISNLQAANQVLLVKVTLENDFTATKKIIFQ
jgi:hypothetical protein